MNYENLKKTDPEVFASVQRELERQRSHIELIASENFTSPAVMEAVGSPLTNKYAEGYPGARYYGGCEYVDEVERIAIARAKAVFGAEHANVQPHSGAQANIAVYEALLHPGDRILGMDLAHGGHLTHGSKASLSGKFFEAYHYGVTRFRAVADEVGAYLMVDIAHIGGLVAAGVHPSPVPYADVVTCTTHKTMRGPRGAVILCREALGKKIDSGVFPGTQGGPLMHVIAGKAVCFQEALQPEFKTYQQQIVRNAQALAEALRACGVRLVSGGTDNHLMLADVFSRGRTGSEMQELLDHANITANKNAIPFDTQPVRTTSGVRFGTPAVTTRGMGEVEMRRIGALICRLIDEGEAAVGPVREEVLALCDRFPLYPSAG